MNQLLLNALNAALALVPLIAIPVIASLLLWGANEMYYRAFGPHRRKAILATAIVGTPVHESAHAIMATLFGMRVTGMSFYKPDHSSGQLGYVIYRFIPYHPIHNIGIFFTAIAPLIAGAYLTYWLFNLAGIPNLQNYLSLVGYEDLFHVKTFRGITDWAGAVLSASASWSGLAVLAATLIGLHATPSVIDMRGSLRGGLAIFLTVIGLLVLTQLFPVKAGNLFVLASGVINHFGVAVLQLALLSVFWALLLAFIGLTANFLTRTSKPKKLNQTPAHKDQPPVHLP